MFKPWSNQRLWKSWVAKEICNMRCKVCQKNRKVDILFKIRKPHPAYKYVKCIVYAYV